MWQLSFNSSHFDRSRSLPSLINIYSDNRGYNVIASVKGGAGVNRQQQQHQQQFQQSKIHQSTSQMLLTTATSSPTLPQSPSPNNKQQVSNLNNKPG